MNKGIDPMGTFDSFHDQNTKCNAQLKCFANELEHYEVGEEIPVERCGFPPTATFCDWGGSSNKFVAKNIINENERMGIFVIVKEGKLEKVTEEEEEIVYPVYDKYGALLAERE